MAILQLISATTKTCPKVKNEVLTWIFSERKEMAIADC